MLCLESAAGPPPSTELQKVEGEFVFFSEGFLVFADGELAIEILGCAWKAKPLEFDARESTDDYAADGRVGNDGAVLRIGDDPRLVAACRASFRI